MCFWKAAHFSIEWPSPHSTQDLSTACFAMCVRARTAVAFTGLSTVHGADSQSRPSMVSIAVAWISASKFTQRRSVSTDSGKKCSTTHRWYCASSVVVSFFSMLVYSTPFPNSASLPASLIFRTATSSRSANCSNSFTAPPRRGGNRSSASRCTAR